MGNAVKWREKDVTVRKKSSGLNDLPPTHIVIEGDFRKSNLSFHRHTLVASRSSIIRLLPNHPPVLHPFLPRWIWLSTASFSSFCFWSCFLLTMALVSLFFGVSCGCFKAVYYCTAALLFDEKRSLREWRHENELQQERQKRRKKSRGGHRHNSMEWKRILWRM